VIYSRLVVLQATTGHLIRLFSSQSMPSAKARKYLGGIKAKCASRLRDKVAGTRLPPFAVSGNPQGASFSLQDFAHDYPDGLKNRCGRACHV
jgi:hypothetical protein